MNIIALDIEATDRDEMLELSIISYPDETEIYHSLFCPPYSQKWSEKIHHISYLDVCDAPTVKEEKQTIQRILDNADVIVGFALDNDIKFLSDNGFNIADNIDLIDVQQMMCTLEEGNNDISYKHLPSLEKAADIMGCGFTDDMPPHSASNDTLVTLRLLDALIKKHLQTDPSVTALYDLLQLVDEKQRQLHRLRAKGFISLIKILGGYKLKSNVKKPADALYSIEVDDRYKAFSELINYFIDRQLRPGKPIFRLNKADIDYFLAYRNEYVEADYFEPVAELTSENSDLPDSADSSDNADNSNSTQAPDLDSLRALMAKFSGK